MIKVVNLYGTQAITYFGETTTAAGLRLGGNKHLVRMRIYQHNWPIALAFRIPKGQADLYRDAISAPYWVRLRDILQSL